MEPTGKFRWLQRADQPLVLQQEFVQLTLERAIKVWKDVPIEYESIKTSNSLA